MSGLPLRLEKIASSGVNSFLAMKQSYWDDMVLNRLGLPPAVRRSSDGIDSA